MKGETSDLVLTEDFQYSQNYYHQSPEQSDVYKEKVMSNPVKPSYPDYCIKYGLHEAFPCWKLSSSWTAAPADTTRVITQLYSPKLVSILASHHKGYSNEHSSSQLGKCKVVSNSLLYARITRVIT